MGARSAGLRGSAELRSYGPGRVQHHPVSSSSGSLVNAWSRHPLDQSDACTFFRQLLACSNESAHIGSGLDSNGTGGYGSDSRSCGYGSDSRSSGSDSSNRAVLWAWPGGPCVLSAVSAVRDHCRGWYCCSVAGTRWECYSSLVVGRLSSPTRGSSMTKLWVLIGRAYGFFLFFSFGHGLVGGSGWCAVWSVFRSYLTWGSDRERHVL